MNGLSLHKQKLIKRLEKIGMEKSMIPGFIWSLKSCFVIDPEISCGQINKRLESLGWPDFKLDHRTFWMLIDCFEAEIRDLRPYAITPESIARQPASGGLT